MRNKMKIVKRNEWYNAYDYDAIIITFLCKYKLFVFNRKLSVGFTDKQLPFVIQQLNENNVGFYILEGDEIIQQFEPKINKYHKLCERVEQLLYENNLTLEEYKNRIDEYQKGLKGKDLTSKSTKKSPKIPTFYDVNKKENKDANKIKTSSNYKDFEYIDELLNTPKKRLNNSDYDHKNPINFILSQTTTTAPPWEKKSPKPTLCVKIGDRVLLEALDTEETFSVKIIESTITYSPTWTGNHSKNSKRTYKEEVKSNAQYSKGEISDKSPLGKALLGKGVGETVTYKPENSIIYKKVKILKIERS